LLLLDLLRVREQYEGEISVYVHVYTRQAAGRGWICIGIVHRI
jgi:hypothetical protein